MDFGMVGPAFSLALSAIGAAIGCGLAGIASHAAMSRTDEGHAKYISISAVPASQMIYGFILMLMLKNAVDDASISALSAAFIGALSGFAILAAAIFQGMCCVSAIQASAKQPGVFAKTFVAIGIVESFALFAFVFSIMLL